MADVGRFHRQIPGHQGNSRRLPDRMASPLARVMRRNLELQHLKTVSFVLKTYWRHLNKRQRSDKLGQIPLERLFGVDDIQRLVKGWMTVTQAGHTQGAQ